MHNFNFIISSFIDGDFKPLLDFWKDASPINKEYLLDAILRRFDKILDQDPCLYAFYELLRSTY